VSLDRRVDRFPDDGGHGHPALGRDSTETTTSFHIKRNGGAIHAIMLSLMVARVT
jgi:hypothetical protein